NTSILVRRPETFDLDTSIHEENGNSREAGFALVVKRVTIDAGLTRFPNSGLIRSAIDRVQSRATFELKDHAGLAAEWNRDQYREGDATRSDFAANRFGI